MKSSKLRYAFLSAAAAALFSIGTHTAKADTRIAVDSLPRLEATAPASFVEHSARGVTLKAPASWKAQESGKAALHLFAPDGVTNVNLMVGDNVPALGDLDKALDDLAAGLTAQVPGLQCEQKGIIQVNGLPVLRLTLVKLVGEVPLRMTQYYVYHDGRLCVVTYASRADTHEKYLAEVEQMVVSLKL